jgi:hypothetical protein
VRFLYARRPRAFIFIHYYITTIWDCQHILPKKFAFSRVFSQENAYMYAFLSFFGIDFSIFCFLLQKSLGRLAHKGTSQGKTIKKRRGEG